MVYTLNRLPQPYIYTRPSLVSITEIMYFSQEYMQRGVDDGIGKQLVHLLRGMDRIEEHILVGVST